MKYVKHGGRKPRRPSRRSNLFGRINGLAPMGFVEDQIDNLPYPHLERIWPERCVNRNAPRRLLSRDRKGN